MIMRGLMTVGGRMISVSGAFWLISALTGFPSPPLQTAIFLTLCLGGLADIGIAAWLNARAVLREAREEGRPLSEAAEDGARRWLGGRAEASRRRRRVCWDEAWIDARSGLASYPRGLAWWAPPPGRPDMVGMHDMVRGMAELSAAVRRMQAQLPRAGALAEKRLAYREAGIDFPDAGPRWSTRDRTGRPTPPFPLHYRTVPDAFLAPDGVSIAPSRIEIHADADHPGCPLCETWRRENGL